MKTIIFILVVVLGIFLIFYYLKDNKTPSVSSRVQPQISSRPTIIPQSGTKSYLFVPYWTLGKNFSANDYERIIYFGVGVTSSGLQTDDAGFEKLELFADTTEDVDERILAIRMVDKNINAQVIKNVNTQQRIATQTVALAKKYKFDGVLLDYETSAFAFDSTIKNISAFYKLVDENVKKSNLKFYVTLYGDTYHQSRPYDVKEIGNLADKIFVMAYDFSKSRGNPGPNFPLYGREKYGYDFGKMVDDFQRDVINDKIVITLGYFGYDWEIDEKGESVSNGVPLSTNEIEKKFGENCTFAECRMQRTFDSNEPFIRYKDEENVAHIVWFEDEKSIAKKKELLNSKGILSTADWAYSYF